MFAVTTMKLCRENPDSDDAKDDNRCDHINHREDDGDNDADDEDEDDGGGGDDDEWVFECCSSAQGLLLPASATVCPISPNCACHVTPSQAARSPL